VTGTVGIAGTLEASHLFIYLFIYSSFISSVFAHLRIQNDKILKRRLDWTVKRHLHINILHTAESFFRS